MFWYVRILCFSEGRYGRKHASINALSCNRPRPCVKESTFLSGRFYRESGVIFSLSSCCQIKICWKACFSKLIACHSLPKLAKKNQKSKFSPLKTVKFKYFCAFSLDKHQKSVIYAIYPMNFLLMQWLDRPTVQVLRLQLTRTLTKWRKKCFGIKEW